MRTSKTMACAGILCVLLLPNTAATQLQMKIDDTVLRVSNGSPFDDCAILLGVSERLTPLPGGALLRIDPLAVLVRGHLDARGNFALDIAKQLQALKEPITILVQAITVVQDSEFFATSNVVTLGIATGGIAPVPVEPEEHPTTTASSFPRSSPRS
jgi:hypothetical protein